MTRNLSRPASRVFRAAATTAVLSVALASTPVFANACGADTADFQEAGGLLVKVRNEAGREIGGQIEYVVQIAVASPQARTINPHNFTVRIEGPNEWGQTAYAYYSSIEGEDYFRDWRISCSMTAPTMRIVGLRAGFVERAVLLVDGKRTLTWNIADKITPASPSPSPQPPANAPPQSPPATPPATPPVTAPPVPTPPATPTPPTTPTPQPTPPQTPAPSVAFKPLNRVDVRVDRVVVARGYPTHQVHAFVTVRNTSSGLQYFTSGFLKALLTDADGVPLERSQPYRASGEPAQLFGATPVIQPGGELKVRYVFTPPEDARLTSLALREGDKRAEFPVSL